MNEYKKKWEENSGVKKCFPSIVMRFNVELLDGVGG